MLRLVAVATPCFSHSMTSHSERGSRTISTYEDLCGCEPPHPQHTPADETSLCCLFWLKFWGEKVFDCEALLQALSDALLQAVKSLQPHQALLQALLDALLQAVKSLRHHRASRAGSSDALLDLS
jgi:hypothetical protein